MINQTLEQLSQEIRELKETNTLILDILIRGDKRLVSKEAFKAEFGLKDSTINTYVSKGIIRKKGGLYDRIAYREYLRLRGDK